MGYTVYINSPHNKSVGHIVGCRNAKVWGGKTTAAGGHVGPYNTRQQAELLGKMSGKPFHWCGICCRSMN
jgi:hypothetical protein